MLGFLVLCDQRGGGAVGKLRLTRSISRTCRVTSGPGCGRGVGLGKCRENTHSILHVIRDILETKASPCCSFHHIVGQDINIATAQIILSARLYPLLSTVDHLSNGLRGKLFGLVGSSFSGHKACESKLFCILFSQNLL